MYTYYGIWFTIMMALSLLVIRKTILYYPGNRAQKYAIVIGMICIMIVCIYGLISIRPLL